MTDADRETLCSELDHVLQDSLFRRSSRYSAFLKYVVEKTLSGDAGELKERSIGTEVFRRQADYDTNADPVVRFCAAEVRKRLAQYYRGAHQATLEIELPIGSYVPRFYRRPIELAEEKLMAEDVEPQSLAAIQAPAPDIPEAGDGHVGLLRPGLLWLLGGVLCLCLIGSAVVVHRRGRESDPIKAVWGDLLDSPSQVQICTGTPPPDGRPVADTPDLSIKQRFAQPGHKISFATASTIAELSAFLQAHNRPYALTEADATTVDNLRNQPLVLVNANNNQWTLFLVKPLRFHFHTEGDVGYIVDSEHPDRRDWKVDFTKPYLDQNADYALVARFLDPTTHAPVLIVAGIGSNGTEAAGDFVTSSTSLAELAKRAPQGWETMNFEALLKVEVIQGHLGATQIAATYFWDQK